MTDITCLFADGNDLLEGRIDLDKEEELIARTVSSHSDKGRIYYTGGGLDCG